MTRLLQIIAGKRAERCGYNLISGLLSNYFEAEEEWDDATVVADEDDLLTPRPETVCSGNDLKSGDEKDPQNKKFLVAQNSVSSNTSVEIYRYTRTNFIFTTIHLFSKIFFPLHSEL